MKIEFIKGEFSLTTLINTYKYLILKKERNIRLKMIAIYARVSTEEQAKNGYSIKAQIRACEKVAASNEILYYIDEGISGEVIDRPSLAKLRTDIKNNLITQVICLDPDRLSRKLINQLILTEEIEKKAQLIFINGEYSKTAEGKLFYQLRGAISEFEKAKITERMSRGRKEKARQGLIVKDYSIYGYDFDKKIKKLIINLSESEIVKYIFYLFTQKNLGIKTIAKRLTTMGIPTKRGASHWSRQVIRQILMNRTYIGEFFQNRWNSEGISINKFKSKEFKTKVSKRPSSEWILINCPRIIDDKDFLLANTLLEESRRRFAGIQKNRYLLSGLLRCGVCNNTMVGRNSSNWGKKVLEYSDIKNAHQVKNKGCGQRIKAKVIEELVWISIFDWIIEPSNLEYFIKNQNNSIEQMDESILNIDKKLLKITQSKKTLINMICNLESDLNSNDIEIVREKLQELTKNEKFLSIEKDKLMNEKHNNDVFSKDFFVDILKNLTFDDKKVIIRTLVREIKVFPEKIIMTGF